MSFDLDFFLFQIFPYIMIITLILGSILRMDRDPYSWRSKSSQLLRKKSLMWGSALFHVGILLILLGHFVGLLTPIWVFEAMGVPHGAKQMLAIVAGGGAGVLCFIGLTILIWRRLFDPRIRATSSFADITILLLLYAQLILGLVSINTSLHHLDGHEMVKFMNWAQHIVTFRGGAVEFVRDTALIFKLHMTLGMLIFTIFPFTRLVHFFSAPVGYLFRKQYQIVRRRET
jgi:nitrate reductase gamma subunit